MKWGYCYLKVKTLRHILNFLFFYNTVNINIYDTNAFPHSKIFKNIKKS